MVQSSYECQKFYMFLPLELTLRPSRVYAAVLVLAHGLALLGVWLAAMPAWAKALAVLALAVGGFYLWREHARSPRGLRVSLSGQVELLDDEWREVQIKGQPVVLRWLVSLPLARESGKTLRLSIWPDSAEPDLLRKLRAWLRWGNQPVRETY